MKPDKGKQLDKHNTASISLEDMSARNNIQTLLLFGLLSFIAAGAYMFSGTEVTFTNWYWAVVGPFAGFVILFQLKSYWKTRIADFNQGPYIGVFIGAVVGSFILSIMVEQRWMVSASLFVVSILLAFLAWFENNPIGITAALITAILTAETATATLANYASLYTFMLGFVLCFAALVLRLNFAPSNSGISETHKVTKEMQALSSDIRTVSSNITSQGIY